MGYVPDSLYCPHCDDGPLASWNVTCTRGHLLLEDQAVRPSIESRSGRSFRPTVRHLVEEPQPRTGSLAVKPEPQPEDLDYGKWIGFEDEEVGTQAEDESSVPSYSPSFTSSASAQSSMTNFSIYTKFSQDQIIQAVEALTFILKDDYDLSSSYRRAIQDGGLSTQKLRQRLRYLFRIFAEELRKEASDDLGHQASRLVRVKAREVAQTITEYYGAEWIANTSTRRQGTQDRSEDDSDDDVDEAPFNENSIRIAHFRDFLLGSTALLTLRANVKALVKLGPERTTAQASHIDEEGDRAESEFDESSIQNRREFKEWGKEFYNGSVRGLEVALIAMGLLEPPLQPGYKRLRWQCTCGDYLFDDYYDYSDGGISESNQNVERIIGATVTSFSGPITGGERFNFRTPSWVSRAMKGVSSSITRSSQAPSQNLPLHQGPEVELTNITINPQMLKQKTLVACMQNGAYGHIPYQDRIEHISTDKELFAFMRETHIARHYDRKTNLLSFKCVKGISFVKFRLWADDNVEVREHSLFCTAVPSCECIPPENLVKPPVEEYECNPAGPPKTGPPFGPNLLMHWLTRPECIHEQQTRVLEQMPKRLKGMLVAKVDQPVDGWGICYLEGWDEVVIVFLFALALLSSLVFAILWSIFKHDIQGAFGVSSYIIATLGVFMMLRTAGRVIN